MRFLASTDDRLRAIERDTQDLDSLAIHDELRHALMVSRKYSGE